MDWLLKVPITHRGLHKGFETPENSMGAFKNAINNNLAIELDVRLTKDKRVVVFHDKNLKRVCASNKKINSLNYKQLQKYRLYNTEEKIPLLSEVLKLINAEVPVLIEIKNYSIVGEFEACVAKELDNYNGEFAICSFNPKVVLWFKKNRPQFIRGLIYGDLKKFGIKFYKSLFIQRIIKTNPHFISLDYKLLKTPLPKIAKAFKKKLISWTIDTKKKRRIAFKIAQNIVFENISLQKSANKVDF